MARTIMILFLRWPRLPLFACFFYGLLCAHDPFFSWISRMQFFMVISQMEQPPSFIAQRESSLVCKLRHYLYCLKQSPRVWFSRFSSMVQEFAMIWSTAYHSVFYHHTTPFFIIMPLRDIYLIVYVDDIVITGNDRDGI